MVSSRSWASLGVMALSLSLLSWDRAPGLWQGTLLCVWSVRFSPEGLRLPVAESHSLLAVCRTHTCVNCYKEEAPGLSSCSVRFPFSLIEYPEAR